MFFILLFLFPSSFFYIFRFLIALHLFNNQSYRRELTLLYAFVQIIHRSLLILYCCIRADMFSISFSNRIAYWIGFVRDWKRTLTLHHGWFLCICSLKIHLVYFGLELLYNYRHQGLEVFFMAPKKRVNRILMRKRVDKMNKTKRRSSLLVRMKIRRCWLFFAWNMFQQSQKYL